VYQADHVQMLGMQGKVKKKRKNMVVMKIVKNIASCLLLYLNRLHYLFLRLNCRKPVISQIIHELSGACFNFSTYISNFPVPCKL